MSAVTLPRAGQPRADRGFQAETRRSEAPAALILAIIAALSALLYLLAFTLPYSLPHWHNWIHFDLERLQLRDQAVHWPMLIALAAEGVLYWLAWRTARRARGPLAWTAAIVGAVLSAAALLPMYPFGSTDIFDYIMHGRMLGIYHANPFVKLADQYPWDLYYQYVGWPHAPSAYGPLWEDAAGKLAAIVNQRYGSAVIPNVIAFKLLVGVFLAGTTALIAAVMRRVSPERALRAVVLFAWNPVILWETLGNGHNDIVMAFWIVAAVLALVYRRYTLGILALVVGALVKFIPLLMLPAAGLIALRDLPHARARLRFLAATGSVALVLIVASYAPFWNGPAVLSVQRRTQMFTSSLPTVIVFLLQSRLGWARASSAISQLAAGLTALFALWEGYRAWHDRSWMSFARSAFDISIFYLLFTALWLWPWYAVWPLALAVLLTDQRAMLAQVAAFALMTKPWTAGWLMLNHPTASTRWDQLRLGPSILALPWLYTIYLLWNTALGGRAVQPATPEGHKRSGGI